MPVLHVPIWAWAATVAALAVLLGADLVISARRRQPVGVGEAAAGTVLAVAAAVAFGALIGATAGGTGARQFFAGWLTEYSLSLDNLLVFVVLISGSQVPRRYHGRVLLLGIGLALLLRGILIALGSIALQQFGWVSYLFGAFLIVTAARMVSFRGGPRRSGGAGLSGGPSGPVVTGPDGPAAGPAGSVLRLARRVLPVTSGGAGGRLTVRVRGRRYATPLLVLVIAIGVTDVLFALDSIPAIFGLTRDPFLVFSANFFALIGLRQLYFLIEGLLGRLVYLSRGLAVILAFIGAKLIAEALRGYGIYHFGPVPVPAMSAELSLAVIAGVLLITTVSSLAAGPGRAGTDPPAGRPGQRQHDWPGRRLRGRSGHPRRLPGRRWHNWAGKPHRRRWHDRTGRPRRKPGQPAHYRRGRFSLPRGRFAPGRRRPEDRP